jgi:hypothetical protein
MVAAWAAVPSAATAAQAKRKPDLTGRVRGEDRMNFSHLRNAAYIRN